jgi:hypothetical protein
MSQPRTHREPPPCPSQERLSALRRRLAQHPRMCSPRTRPVCEALLEGASVSSTARRFGRLQSSISRTAKRLGLEPYETGWARRRARARLRFQLASALQQGCGYRTAARRCGRVPSTLVEMLLGRAPAHLGRCTVCGKPAAARHHVTYVPACVIHLCRPCHCRIHRVIHFRWGRRPAPVPVRARAVGRGGKEAGRRASTAVSCCHDSGRRESTSD